MRIVGGRWRGRPLEAPSGRDVTRPTTDRVREAIASMILSARGLDLSGASVLDAFAGSGAMGLELLSRGAANVTFVDRDRASVFRVRRNAAAVGASAPAVVVVQGDVGRLVGTGRLVGAPFDVVVLDPPYATPASDVSRLVGEAAERGMLDPRALVLYERSCSRPSLDLPGAVPLRRKRYGTTCVDLFGLGGDRG